MFTGRLSAGIILAVMQLNGAGLEPVRLDGGLVAGVSAAAGRVRVFKGIPFAAPPVGSLRWRAPVPPSPWTGVRDAGSFSESCAQPGAADTGNSPAGAPPALRGSEDCLYLNVWTGAQSAQERRPVVMWVYGGGFRTGSGSGPAYDGENLAKRGVVFVTINYRVGVFGFFSHPELTRESGVNASGNYGLMDQIAALQWIHRNIAAFGGDPANVTIAGQSAGALCVNLLVASPQAKNLFHRVIAESGADVGYVTVSYPGPREEAERGGIAFGKSLNADSLAKLRQLPTSELLKGNYRSGPVQDGYVLPQDSYEIFASGKQNDVPILTGFNTDDVAGGGYVSGASEFRDLLERRFGAADTADLLKAFPAKTDEEAKVSAAHLSRATLFAWQSYTWLRLQGRTGKSKAFLYYFSRVPPGPMRGRNTGAYHSAEISYALDTLEKGQRPWEETDRQLSRTMSSFWINFATKGDPNGKDLPAWPAYSEQKENVMGFGDKIGLRDVPFKEELIAVDSVFDKHQPLPWRDHGRTK